MRSPLSKGVLLADEVGLGKTIEAGLILCQLWAERKRKLLIVCPAALRKQWHLELKEKFNLPSTILEAKNFNQMLREGIENPFEQKEIVITSIHFANKKKDYIRLTGWEIVVIDEAHKLRNAYKVNNKMGQNIRWALEDTKKILLTATPLQNSLLELYGLSSIIDEHIFRDLDSFRTQFVHDNDLEGLKVRIRRFCHRTLRNEVLEYIKYTERKALTRPFRPNDAEQDLYERISEFLRREDTYAVPNQQRTLTTLVLRKLLASSTSAIIGTLETILERLKKLKKGSNAEQENILEQIVYEDEIESEIIEESSSEEEASENDSSAGIPIDATKLDKEIAEIEEFIRLAKNIDVDTKTKTLLTAIDLGFQEMEKMGAARKAVIFSESRRTQDYLKAYLDANGFEGKVVLFNGTNTDSESKKIYETWLKSNESSGRVSGSRTADMRTALVEKFRNEAEILLATESAAEGINLQFCSLLINYDLPWNPQRIEQRIGRCHRYGQKHDVVVINFLNERNEADRRVHELLRDKLQLFSGLLGASDDVLGSIESGVDFEKRILSIYQSCRTPEAIQEAFQKLQDEMEESIKNRLKDTEQKLFKHFDDDVRTRLRMRLDDTKNQLDYFEKRFWHITKYVLAGAAKFDDKELQFQLSQSLSLLDGQKAVPGVYHLISKNKHNVDGTYLYRFSHPLGEYVVQESLETETPPAELTFDVSSYPGKISVIEALKGQSGYLNLHKIKIESFESEEYLVFSGYTDSGEELHQEVMEKLFLCPAEISNELDDLPSTAETKLNTLTEHQVKATVALSLESNNRLFNEERERLERWAEDLVLISEKELKDTKNKIKELNRQSRNAQSIEEQHELQSRIRDLEKLQRRQRQRIFEVEDEIIEKRDNLIQNLEKRMHQKTQVEELFTIRWKVV